MLLKLNFRARMPVLAASALAIVLFGSGRVVFAGGQAAAPQQPGSATEAQKPQIPESTTSTGPLVRLTADEAVRMALENNLGVQAERLAPQINTLNVAQARAVYAPVLFSNF